MNCLGVGIVFGKIVVHKKSCEKVSGIDAVQEG